MNKILLLPAALLLAAALPAIGQDAPPPPEPSAQTEAVPEPEITIRPSADGMIEEYRIKGRLYMVKISPKNAPPYYLIDNDGDGELETRHNGPMESRLIPQWILFRW
ncbi:MAG: DUF2782 domain-containing protein [Pseudomonadota bacterium]